MSLPDYAGMLERGARVDALQDAAELCLIRSETMKPGARKLEAESCAIAIFRTARTLAEEHGTDILWNRKLVLLVETGDTSEPPRDEPPGTPVTVPASPPEDWPSPLMVASGESTPGGAAKKLDWPLDVCEAINAEWTAIVGPYEVRYLKAVRAGKASLERGMGPPMIPEDWDRVRDELDTLARPFMDELEGGDE